MKHQRKKVAYLGLLTAIALILSYVESLFPPIFVAVPGIKMGLPNIVIVYILYNFGAKYAAVISVTRVFIVSMLFGNAMILMYSLAGALLSIAAMCLFKKLNFLSCVGVSIVGGVMHNLGQITVAAFVLHTSEIFYYMAVLAITGTIAGIFVGIAGGVLVKRIKM